MVCLAYCSVLDVRTCCIPAACNRYTHSCLLEVDVAGHMSIQGMYSRIVSMQQCASHGGGHSARLLHRE